MKYKLFILYFFIFIHINYAFIIKSLFNSLNNNNINQKININNNKKLKDIKSLPITKLPNYNTYLNNYWYDPRIHNFGNIGIYGFIHAIIAPFASKLIDYLSYNNTDVRNYNYSVIDFCCGIGFSTHNNSIGIDTSNQMLSVAKIINKNKKFINCNAEIFGYKNSCDVVTIMFATHEMPSKARRNIINNALKNAKKYVLIIDIDPYNFAGTLLKKINNGSHFLSGEPYILNYIIEMNSDINFCNTQNLIYWKLNKINIINNHVVLWNFTKRF